MHNQDVLAARGRPHFHVDWAHLWQVVRRHPVRAGLAAWAVALALTVVIAPLRSVAATLTGRVIVLVASPIAPSVAGFDDLPQPSRVLAADGSELATLSGGEQREPVPLDRLPRHVVDAVLAAEDRRFYRHNGVDAAAVVRAAVHSLRGDSEGGSTITQQLAKINYTGGERTLFRKLREALYAVELERKYSKDELLEHYLSQIYFGDGAYGIAAAARSYFGVEPEHLSVAQAALLAAKIRAPEEIDPRSAPAVARAGRDDLLEAMHGEGWIDERALRQAKAAPIEVVPPAPKAGTDRAPHFVAFVRDEAESLPGMSRYRLNSGGLTIKTTLDPKAYDAAVASAQESLSDPADPAVAMASVVPGDGAIRLLYSDPDHEFDIATRATRQPGSAFKPFVFLGALEKGIDPRSLYDASSPFEFVHRGEKFTVDNYEGTGGGQETVHDATVRSINTVYARLVLEIGPEAAAEAAVKAGIPADILEPDRTRPAIALGGLTKGVDPLAMATAYATFAARGTYAEPYSITSVVDRDGAEVFRRSPRTESRLDEAKVGVLNQTLMDVVRGGTGTAARVGRWQIAGKTGTTQRHGDAWFTGYSATLATSVWVGHPDAPRPMENVHGRKVTGGSFPASLFADVMRAGLSGQRPRPLHTRSPDGLGLERRGVPPAPPPSAPAPTVTLPVLEQAPPLAETTTTQPAPSTTRPRQSTTTRPTTTTTRPPRQSTTTSPPPSTTAPDEQSGRGSDPSR